MKTFLEWLEGFGGGSISIYQFGGPPEADEWGVVVRQPNKLDLFKTRLKAAKKLGNYLINMDLASIEKIPIISPKGKNLPTNDPWK
jgi:hypothetical protein